MTPRTSTCSRRLKHVTRLAAAGAIAAGAMMLPAPAGNAIPESTIKSECDAAGGEYTIVTDGEHSYSRCCYRDIKGEKHCDHYTDGKYTYETLEQPETPPPPPPQGEVVGPPATAATQPPPPPGVIGPTATLATQPPPPAPPEEGMILWPGYTQIPAAPAR